MPEREEVRDIPYSVSCNFLFCILCSVSSLLYRREHIEAEGLVVDERDKLGDEGGE